MYCAVLLFTLLCCLHIGVVYTVVYTVGVVVYTVGVVVYTVGVGGDTTWCIVLS